MTGQRSIYWKPRFLAALCLAGLLLVSSANLPISPIQARLSNAPVASPKPAPVNTGYSDWIWQNPLPQGNGLTNVTCPGNNVCYAVGTHGVIFKTLDSGMNWSLLEPNFTRFSTISDITCPTVTDCFILQTTNISNFLSSNDGGHTWVTKVSPTSDFSAISCPGTLMCYAVGPSEFNSSGYIYASNDGGNTWNKEFTNPVPLNKVTCPDTNTCYAIGESGSIIATKNGGQNWNVQSYQTFDRLVYISCPNSTTCYATSANPDTKTSTIVKTSDGSNWNSISFGTVETYAPINCPSTLICYAVGDDALWQSTLNPLSSKLLTGRLLKTSDGGVTWTPIFAGLNAPLDAISCLDDSNCVAVGEAGGMIAITNGGASWTPRYYGSTSSLNAITCPSLTTCVSAGKNGTILVSEDMGINWISQTLPTNNELKGINCTDPANCVSVGITGTILTGGLGSAWISRNSGTTANLNAISCPIVNICYAVGNGGIVLYSNNNGITWSSQNSTTANNLNSISCITGTITCFAVGDNNTIITNSGGNNWDTQSFSYSGGPYQLQSISCPTLTTCFATLNTAAVISTTNSGNTWNVQTVNLPLIGISCINPVICYAITSSHSIFFTIDGGSHWSIDYAPTFYSLSAITCISDFTCRIVGIAGMILSNQPTVIKNVDTGNTAEYGTFSYALNKAITGQTIVFNLNGTIVSPTTTLQALKLGVSLYGSFNCSTPITLDFQNNAAISLNLSGQNTLQGIKIIHAAGTGIKATGTGNVLRCTKIQR